MTDDSQDPIIEALAAVLKASLPINNPSGSRQRLQCMDIVLNGPDCVLRKRAYYITDGTVKFRHEGDTTGVKMPPRLFLNDLTAHEDKILVYYSASGSGKTAELVGSSASRDAHLAFVLSVKDPSTRSHEKFEALAEGEVASGNPALLRNREHIRRKTQKLAADAAIRQKLTGVVVGARDQLKPVLQAAMDTKTTLKVVLALDEASSCPKIIRGILRSPKYMELLVRGAFHQSGIIDVHTLQLRVQVSLGGTGVWASTIGSDQGSLQKDFIILSPYHEVHWERVIDSTLNTEKINVRVPGRSHQREHIYSLQIISKHFPVIETMMANGRMASIALAELRKCADGGDFCDKEVQEAVLVDKIVQSFMKSNGMSVLVNHPEAQRAVAASALAVHLFRKLPQFRLTVPRNDDEIAEFAIDMDFFDFERQTVNVKELVATYGLLEPAVHLDRFQRNRIIEPPVHMKTAQQLITVYMLGLGLGLDSMHMPSWFGFELMSTHFIKCAIAASTTIPMEKRPSVGCTLTRLGFAVDENATSDTVAESFEGLFKLKAVPTVPSSEGVKTLYHSYTRQVNAGLEIFQDNDKDRLRIDNTLYRTIRNSCDGIYDFGSPIACINEGNSSFCDGIVTFFVKESELEHCAPRKMSIMNQAKDYHGKTRLNTTQLNQHAETMSKPVFDGVFGDHRLMCVASGHSSLIATKEVSIKREYIPYPFNRGILLRGLLEKLQAQRSKGYKAEMYSCVCDENGELVETVERDSRKRKAPDSSW